MRFFTRKWCRLEYEDSVLDRVLRDYKRYIARIRDRLPASMQAFVEDISRHDALFRRVVLRPRDKRLVMALRCADVVMGCYDLDMAFEGVVLTHRDRRELRLAANRRKTEVLSDEVDVTEEKGTFEYRLICWPEGEVTIRFRRFSYKKTPVKDREFVAANPRFRVG